MKPGPRPSISMRNALNDPKLPGGVLAGDSWAAWRIPRKAAGWLSRRGLGPPCLTSVRSERERPERPRCGFGAFGQSRASPCEREETHLVPPSSYRANA
jgi:hypothetical protein